jgi:hypothetical protein
MGTAEVQSDAEPNMLLNIFYNQLFMVPTMLFAYVL